MSAVADARLGAAVPLSAAPPSATGLLSRGTLLKIATGAALAALVGGVPLLPMLAVYGALVGVVGVLISPRIGLYALLFAIPFSPTFGLEDAAFSVSIFEPLALLMILVWLVQGLIRREIVVPREGLAGALLLLVTVLLLAGGGATSIPLAVKETLKWVLLALAYVFTRVTIRDDRSVRAVLTALFLAAAGQALTGVGQFVLGIGPPTFAVGGFMRAHGMFGQPNPFAGYLGTVLPLALAMTLAPQPVRFRAVAALALAMTALGIALSLSRGAWLGLAISLTVMALAWSGRARKLVPPLVAAAAIVVVLAMIGALPPTIASRITSVIDNFGVFDVRTVPLTSENFAVVERMAHWQAGWWMFLDHPILGVGTGNYPAVYDEYYVHPWKEALGHAHNYYLNMAAEAGLLGLFALLLVLGLAFRGLLRRIRATAPDRRSSDAALLDPPLSPALARALALGLLGSLAMFSIHNLFDNLLVHGVGIQIGVLLGLIGGMADR